MRENRLSGSEGGARFHSSPRPLSPGCGSGARCLFVVELSCYGLQIRPYGSGALKFVFVEGRFLLALAAREAIAAEQFVEHSFGVVVLGEIGRHIKKSSGRFLEPDVGQINGETICPD